MSHSTAEARAAGRGAVAGAAPSFRWPFVLVGLAFLFLWVEIIRQLASEWSLNPQYGYGWTVPFLAAYVFYQRWRERPAREPARFFGLTTTLVLLAAALLFPARLVAVANPDWRLLSWTMALAAVVISLGAIQLAGGLPWLRHFAFPVLFFLVAVPWPAQLEQFVVQNLMRADSATTIQILNFIGTLAVQHGNVIELSTGQVGIDDACTGVRSLQATFMVALFLGAFYQLPLRRRLLLVGAGLVLAFVCNIGRTFLLCQIAANDGIAAIHRWHDPAGFTILFICLFALWGMCLFLQPKAPELAVNPQPSTINFSARWPLALIVWLCLTEITTALWYAPPAAQPASNSWSVTWPTNEPNYKSVAIPADAEELLRYNEGGAATWRSADDRPWMMYSFHWLPGRTAALFVKNHRPDICLPASGLTMQQESGIELVRVNDVNLPIRSYRFADNGRPLHIFYCYWDGRASYTDDAAASEDWTFRGRLRAAWSGRRERGARMLELAVWGHESDTEAGSALREELAKVVHRAL